MHITLRPHPRKLTQKFLLPIALCKLPKITLQNLWEVVTLDRALRLSGVKPLEQVVSATYLGLYP